MRTFFGHSISRKKSYWFYLHKILFKFLDIFTKYLFSIKSVINTIADFFPDFLVISAIHHLLFKKHKFSLIIKTFLYPLIFESIIQKNLTFSSFFTKRNLRRYYYFINIKIVYVDWVLRKRKFMFFSFNIIKRYNFFIHLLYRINNSLYFIMIHCFCSNQNF